MKNLMKAFVLATALIGFNGIGFVAHAETTTGDKVQEGVEDAGKNTKKAYRDAKDKACEMVNGKMECAGKRAMNKARNAKDEVKDKANDVEKRID